MTQCMTIMTQVAEDYTFQPLSPPLRVRVADRYPGLATGFGTEFAEVACQAHLAIRRLGLYIALYATSPQSVCFNFCAKYYYFLRQSTQTARLVPAAVIVVVGGAVSRDGDIMPMSRSRQGLRRVCLLRRAGWGRRGGRRHGTLESQHWYYGVCARKCQVA